MSARKTTAKRVANMLKCGCAWHTPRAVPSRRRFFHVLGNAGLVVGVPSWCLGCAGSAEPNASGAGGAGAAGSGAADGGVAGFSGAPPDTGTGGASSGGVAGADASIRCIADAGSCIGDAVGTRAGRPCDYPEFRLVGVPQPDFLQSVLIGRDAAGFYARSALCQLRRDQSGSERMRGWRIAASPGSASTL